MKMYLFSGDEDTLTGMRLAGIEGEVISSAEQLEQATQRLTERKDIGVLLIAVTLGEKYPQQILELKKLPRPLVTQIPDMISPSSSGDSIARYVRDTVGINLD